MTISDPIADMLTRIRNVAMVGKTTVAMPSSKLKSEVARILTEEGYLESYEVVDGKSEAHKILRMKLKYIGERRQRRPIITGLERVSHPGCRVTPPRMISPGYYPALVSRFYQPRRVS